LRLLYYLLTIPYIIIGKLFLLFNIFDMKNKLNKCTQIVDVKSNEISDIFVEYLILLG